MDFPQIALIAWIVISIGMFATLPPLRAFLLTYIIGILFLPVEKINGDSYLGSIMFSQAFRIEKFTACNIAAIFGTVIFAPQVIRRFRFHWFDLSYAAIIVGIFLTSLANGIGPKDGGSSAMQNLRQFLPLLILTRMYLATPNELLQAMRAIIGGGVVYAVISLLEFRLSPQLHATVYGYFQHSFDQFMRYGHFRPAGFLEHAIEMSFFLGSTTALVGWLWYKRVFAPLWGMIPVQAVFSILLIGLLCTLTFAGYAALLIAGSMFALFAFTRSRWVLVILPVAALLWMGSRYTNIIDKDTLLSFVNTLEPDRAQSLETRFDSEKLHLDAASKNPLLGRSADKGVLQSEYGRVLIPVDAWWLITFTFYGIVGLGGWTLVWFAGTIDAFRRWHKLTPDLRLLAAAVSILIGCEFVDFLFNSFPSVFLMMLNVGMVSTLAHYVPVRAPRRVMVAPPHPPVAPNMGVVG